MNSEMFGEQVWAYKEKNKQIDAIIIASVIDLQNAVGWNGSQFKLKRQLKGLERVVKTKHDQLEAQMTTNQKNLKKQMNDQYNLLEKKLDQII